MGLGPPPGSRSNTGTQIFVAAQAHGAEAPAADIRLVTATRGTTAGATAFETSVAVWTPIIVPFAL
jgi:hypothetical protein